MFKIIDKKESGWGWDKKPRLWHITIQNGNQTYTADVDANRLRKLELHEIFDSRGYDMKLIEEWGEISWREGQESTYED